MNNTLKEKAILQIKYPIITSYTSDAHMLAILNNYQYTEECIFNNFISFWGEEPSYKNNFNMLRFHSWKIRRVCPYFKIKYYDKKLLDSDIVEFIISKIDLGNYIAIWYDQFYIPNSRCYNKIHFEHEMLIYGYDRETKVFYIADFFENNKYSFVTVLFNCVESAVIGALESESFSCDEIEFCNANYKFSYSFLKNSLNNFLHSTNTVAEGENVVVWEPELEQIQKGGYTFGIKNYSLLKKALSKASNSQTGIIAFTPLHVIFDHKVMMCERLKYLVNRGLLDSNDNIIAEYSNIKDISQSNRNLFIKCMITKEYKLLDKIISKLDIIEELEIEAITYLIEKLSANPDFE